MLCFWPVVFYGNRTGNNPNASWLDQRNQSRIAQFEARRAALLVSASTSSDANPSGGAVTSTWIGSSDAAGKSSEGMESTEVSSSGFC